MKTMPEHPPLKNQLAQFIDGGPGDFEALALALYQHQHQHNPLYAAISDPSEPQHWQDIPCIPVDLFKDLDFACFDLTQPHTTFHTSGTTQGRPGRHHSLDTELYNLGSIRHFRARVPNAPENICSICPPGGGTSSLGHMIELFGRVQGFFSLDRGLDFAAWDVLRDPVFLASTAYALAGLLEGSDRSRQLGPESLVMVTGGFKGRKTRLDAPELYRSLQTRLGTPRVVGEYGMTELSSQLWTDPVPAGQLPGAFVAPRHLRVYTVDPDTGRPNPQGGLLRFVDLANYWSVLGIETLDLGIVDPDPTGDRVQLIGRLEGAPARGCSLAAEELLHRA